MSTNDDPDPYGLKHRPVFLLPYEEYDGPYAGKTDCKFVSVGWAQYDPRSLSVKTMRHSGTKWSRLSEEIPLHRAVDTVLLLSLAIETVEADAQGSMKIPSDTFEAQSGSLSIPTDAENPTEARSFQREIMDPLLLRRLGKLREVLNRMHTTGTIP